MQHKFVAFYILCNIDFLNLENSDPERSTFYYMIIFKMQNYFIF